MTRRLLIALFAVCLSAHLTACSSSGGKDDTSVAESNDETFAEEGAGDFADDSNKTANANPADAPPADGGAAVADNGDLQDPSAAPPADAGAKPEDSGSDLALNNEDPSQQQQVAQNPDAPQSDMPADAPPADAPPADLPPADTTAQTTTTDTQTTTTAQNTGDLSLDSDNALPSDSGTQNITDNPSSPSDAGVFNSPSGKEQAAIGDSPADTTPEPKKPRRRHSSGMASTSAPAASSVSYSPLAKVKDAAFTGPGGATLNRVYIARPKDTTKTVSQKIFNSPDRAKELVTWNPQIKRGMKPGDKVYYPSAANPSDSKMMNYYEEAGVAPSSYTSKDGDNLRAVAKNLLGFKDAWKEVYATNATVESKGKIPAGLELKYWPDAGTAAPVQQMAQNGMPSTLPDAAPKVPTAAGTTAPPANPFENAPPPNPGQPVADNGQGPDPMAPQPPNDAAAQAQATPPPANAAGTVAPPPGDLNAPVPPPVQAAATPPPPAPPKPPKKVVAAPAAEEGGMDADTTMALGVGGVLLLAAAILFVVIRKNRAKRMDLGQTQV